MRRLAYALLVGLVGAGIVHIAIVILLPGFAAEENWDKVRNALPLNRMTRQGLPIFAPDPFFHMAACRFDLRNGPVRLQASGTVSAWFLTLYAPDGTSLAGLDERSTAKNSLDVVVLTPEQLVASGSSPPESTPLEVEAGEALAVVQVFVPDPSWTALTDAFLASAACASVPRDQ